MTLQRIAGIVLVILGLVALLAGGISYTQTKKVLDIGPLQATTQEHKTIPLSPVLGIVGLIAGIALLAIPSRSRT
jgi:uncharacterized membrane protein YidH (DUF202 family)